MVKSKIDDVLVPERLLSEGTMNALVCVGNVESRKPGREIVNELNVEGELMRMRKGNQVDIP